MLRHESYPNLVLQRDNLFSVLDCESLSVSACEVAYEKDLLRLVQSVDPLIPSLEATQAGNPEFFKPAISDFDPDSALANARMTTFAPFVLGQKSYLNRLTINIANSCNLWCSYCYADHGQYYDQKHLMKPARGVKIFNNVSALYEVVGNIHFFGGEPLLNPKCIDAVCAVAREKYPDIQFTATTNGTLATEEILDVLERWGVALTISIDGPEPVHDAKRPKVSGGGSHADICQSVKKFTARGISWSIECTYNKSHVESDLSVSELVTYFHDAFGERTSHIAWSFVPLKDLVANESYLESGVFRNDLDQQEQEFVSVDYLTNTFRDAARLSVKNALAGQGGSLSFVHGVLSSLYTKQKSDSYCPAFSSQISIGSNGDIYPCFMFFGDPRMCIGNIERGNFDIEASQRLWLTYMREYIDTATGTYRWFRHLGSGCVAGDYISTGSFSKRLYEGIHEAIIEEVLLGVAQAQISKTNNRGQVVH